MRRFVVVTGLALVASALMAGQASAGKRLDTLAGTFSIQFPKGHPASNAPCPPDEFCGVGRFQGFGTATITIVDESFEELPDSDCLAVTRSEAIQPVGTSDVLVLDENGTFCPPGGSGDSHAGPSSYGFPGVWSFTFSVDGADSEGVFAGATGDGTVRFETAGGIGVWRVRGSLNLT
jgi:hypothetical protein